MDLNEIFKKFVDSTIGMAGMVAEKMADFTETVSKKGQEFKEDKKDDIEKFFNTVKEKYQKTSEAIMGAVNLKDKRVDELTKRIETLEKEVEALKKAAKK